MTNRDRKRLTRLAYQYAAQRPCPRCGNGPDAPHASGCPRDALPSASDYDRAESAVRQMLTLVKRVAPVSIAAAHVGQRLLDADGDPWSVVHEGAIFAPEDDDRMVLWGNDDLDEADELFGPFIEAGDAP